MAGVVPVPRALSRICGRAVRMSTRIAAAAAPSTKAGDDLFNPPRPRRASHPVPFDSLNLEQLGQFYKRAVQIWEASSTLSYHGAAVATAAEAVVAIVARHQHALRHGVYRRASSMI
eukprot:jgi/Tetstr1/455340/TSEL_042175.t1